MALPDAHQVTPPTPPPPLSINRLVALYPRERLLVHPLRWTDRQLALLDCRIHDHDEEAGAHEAASSEPDAYTRFLARRLSRSFDDGVLADTVLNLIWPLRGHTSVEHNRAVSLYFHQRSRASIRFCCLSVSVPGPDAEIISLACIDYHDTMRERRQHFKPPPNRHYTDWPGLWRAGLLSLRHTPKEPEKDPFLVALIIALAQQERRYAAQPLPSDSSFTVGPFP
ncbi:hypothetical protein B0T25DRAFT_58895 [Lasiosphaeria hispida]|uniref:Uncharacterized protein n=1 Tax=Lasiosphaeria hispida TaxID=260671 RepID=A0AAJ0MKT4_9PEZI|nr:hypothetical protein B0T25DRAFT_58895 [Lasiosphaeria hispida]